MRSIAPTEIFRCSTDSTISELPVNSSLPEISTIANPAGNTHALTSRAADSFPIRADATVLPTPANAMNAPAITASSSILQNGNFPFKTAIFS